METKIKELKREHCENIQKLQKEHQAEIELMCINNPDRKAVEVNYLIFCLFFIFGKSGLEK